MQTLKLTALIFLILSSTANSYSGVNFEEITLDDVIEKAKRAGKSIMIDFYTDWCVPCKELDKRIFQDPTISRFINQRFLSLRINAEEEVGLKLMKKYQVSTTYPTVLFLDSEGKEIDRIVGLSGGKEDYFKIIQDYTEGRNTFPVLLTQLNKDKDNPTLIFKIADSWV